MQCSIFELHFKLLEYNEKMAIRQLLRECKTMLVYVILETDKGYKLILGEEAEVVLVKYSADRERLQGIIDRFFPEAVTSSTYKNRSSAMTGVIQPAA